MDSTSGDSYKRIWRGDRAQCGCYWTRIKEYGDVLKECPIHKAATIATVKRIQRKLKGEKR